MKYIEVIVLFLLFLLFDNGFNYEHTTEFSVIVGLSKNFSVKELLSWFLIYSYMYTCLMLSCFQFLKQKIISYSVVRYDTRINVMNQYLKKVLINIAVNVGILLMVIIIRKVQMPDLIITSEYVLQSVAILIVGLLSSLIMFMTKNLYLSIVGVNAYILGVVVFSDIFSKIPVIGVVLAFPSYLNRIGRVSSVILFLEMLLVLLFIVVHYVVAKKINYL
ncbi:hypothetical protein UAY_03209 [Enterococcus moraviensis ATCC BAA-383]|uniref:Uncharacterized protein n=1 Tax=Enterococcus moraviensis ATCC BAA-383 TaxID=1158609 RepID=R2QKS2_9ENTE|nr:hypothetical protein [Enterococcus moraviensis]EOH95783.1 hypothetical protein UAY_03209 [Enterococcus moraviensis ATCC BAA-383]EOT66270.1 hypothetical protein I586_02541 [Enterococcus moraviensis ATCC BAA-383]